MNAKQARKITRILIRLLPKFGKLTILKQFQVALAVNPLQVFDEITKACHYPPNASQAMSKMWSLESR